MHYYRRDPQFPGTIPDYAELVYKACGLKDPWTQKMFDVRAWEEFVREQKRRLRPPAEWPREWGLEPDPVAEMLPVAYFVLATGLGVGALIWTMKSKPAAKPVEQPPVRLKPAA